MADKNMPKKKKFQMVTTSPNVAGGARRDDSSVTVHPSGYTIANRGGTDIMDTVAGSPDSNYLVKFGADPETKTVAVYAGTTADQGLMRIRRYKGKGGTRVAFHLGGVWNEHPSLRPPSKGEYAVKYDTDEDGIPYLEIALAAPLGKRKGASNSSGEATAETKKGDAAAESKKGDPAAETKKAAPSDNK